MKRLLPTALLVITVTALVSSLTAVAITMTDAAPSDTVSSAMQSDAIIAKAFTDHAANVQVRGQGIVTTLLADDTSGSRHQRFIIRLASGQTLLITHNIDIAPRIDSLQVGDNVAFYGEYEWNVKGGLIHWTHRDPDGSHVAGWIEHGGKRYQ